MMQAYLPEAFAQVSLARRFAEPADLSEIYSRQNAGEKLGHEILAFLVKGVNPPPQF